MRLLPHSIAVCVLLASGWARAVEPHKTLLTLDEALAYAEAHQPDLKVALQRIVVEQRQAGVSRARWFPSVRAGAELAGGTENESTGAVFGVPGVDAPRYAGKTVVRDGDYRPYASSFAGVGVRQEIFDFGRYTAEAAVHDALAEAERSHARALRLDLRFAVEEAYYGVLTARQLLRAAEEAFARAERHRQVADAGVKTGLHTPVELIRAEADLARDDAGRLRARAGVEIALAGLAATLGAPDLALDVSEALPPAREAPPLPEGVPLAISRDPALRQLALRRASLHLETRAIFSQLAPELSLEGVVFGYGGGTPPDSGVAALGGGFLPSVVNYSLALVVTVPIVDAVTWARGRVGKAREAVARDEGVAAETELVARVRRAYLERDMFTALTPSLEQAVRAADANSELVDARFHAGFATSVEVADAEALREEAEVQLALGRFSVLRARASLTRVLSEGP